MTAPSLRAPLVQPLVDGLTRIGYPEHIPELVAPTFSPAFASGSQSRW